MKDITKDVKRDLPNFPNEVIEIWFQNHGSRLGWPPEGATWNKILCGFPLSYWQKTHWEYQTMDLENTPISKESAEVIQNMYLSYFRNQPNNYSVLKEDGGMYRVIQIAKSLKANGRFPRPLVLLFSTNSYHILDGHHRYITWLFLHRMLPHIKDPKKRKQYNVSDEMVKWVNLISPKQFAWVANHK